MLNNRGSNAKHFFAISLVSLLIYSGSATAENIVPAPVLPETLRWGSPPNLPGIQGAWIIGSEKSPGHYVLRVKLASGARIPPHTHPDERNTTVLAGTIYVGFGEFFAEDTVVAVPTGAVYIAPANVPHYIWSKEGEAIYQEAGVGPTETIFIKR